MIETPYIEMVPKSYRANLAFRRDMVKAGCEEEETADDLWAMCARDPLFYFNTFVWTFDPRKSPPVIPFITYPYQDDAFRRMFGVLGQEDLLIEKSRDMGASWMCLLVFQHQWHFREMQSFLCVSRNEDYVDKKGNPKSLFWKLDLVLSNLPPWLRPMVKRSGLHLENLENGSAIDGESTTGDVGRGDRRRAVLLDEFAAFGVDEGYKALAATGDATPCRIFNSTPQGTGNAFYDMHETDEVAKIRLHWSQHPEKARGLYQTGAEGSARVIDKTFSFPSGYPFLRDGKLRSPWYDREEKRRPIPLLVAQELDIDFLGSTYQFFDKDALDRILAADTRPPFLVGDLACDPDLCVPLFGDGSPFIERAKGPLRMWIYPDAHGRFPSDRKYALGVDISMGTGASNSCISVADARTREKVAEYVSSNIKPQALAKVAVAMARWFGAKPVQRRDIYAEDAENRLVGGAFLIWESNGPGRLFGDKVLELGYRDIYYRRKEKSLGQRQTDIPGWAQTPESKLALLGDFRAALNDGSYVERSRWAVREAREYVFEPNGKVSHSRSVSTLDPTGARSNHGDLVMADALCWRGVKELAGAVERPPEEEEPPIGSFAWRNQMADAAKRDQEHW